MMIFKLIEDKINVLLSHLTTAAVQPQVNALENIIYAYIVVWVMFRGYLILAGKSEDPLKGLIFDAALKMAVVAVVFNPAWIQMISNAIDGMNSWASGSTSLFTRMDELLKKTFDVSGRMIDMDHSMVPIEGYASAIILMAGFVVFSVLTVWIMASTTLMLKVLIMISPIMIYSSLYSWFKDIFSNWLKLIIANTLTVLIVGVFLNALDGSYREVIDTAKTEVVSSNIFAQSIEIAILTIFLGLAVLMAREIAQQLAGASIEHLPGSAGAQASAPFRAYRNWKDRREQRRFYRGRE
jgi:type IV secretion system protein VirB6